MGYAERLYGLGDLLDGLHDQREAPRIPTRRVLRGLFLMVVVRIGSLHGREQTRPGGAWRRWLGGALPSADTLSRAAAQLVPDDLLRSCSRVRDERPPTMTDFIRQFDDALGQA